VYFWKDEKLYILQLTCTSTAGGRLQGVVTTSKGQEREATTPGKLVRGIARLLSRCRRTIGVEMGGACIDLVVVVEMDMVRDEVNTSE
jgi:hypothetical protein